MANNLIPPMPTGVLPGSAYWNDWIEKLRTLINNITTSGVSWASITGKPTTLTGFGITDAINVSQKDAVNGVAALNSVSRVDKGVTTTDYIVANSSTKGFTMLSPNGHYWVATISNTGVVTWTDVGTTSP